MSSCGIASWADPVLTATLRHTIPLAGDARLLSADIMANGRALLMEQAADERICVRWLDESGERGPPLLSDDDNCGEGDGYDPETDRLVLSLIHISEPTRPY